MAAVLHIQERYALDTREKTIPRYIEKHYRKKKTNFDLERKFINTKFGSLYYLFTYVRYVSDLQH